MGYPDSDLYFYTRCTAYCAQMAVGLQVSRGSEMHGHKFHKLSHWF